MRISWRSGWAYPFPQLLDVHSLFYWLLIQFGSFFYPDVSIFDYLLGLFMEHSSLSSFFDPSSDSFPIWVVAPSRVSRHMNFSPEIPPLLIHTNICIDSFCVRKLDVNKANSFLTKITGESQSQKSFVHTHTHRTWTQNTIFFNGLLLKGGLNLVLFKLVDIIIVSVQELILWKGLNLTII